MSDQPTCAAIIMGGTGWSSYPCGAGGKLFEDGKWWCKRHAPSVKRARYTASQERWARERAEEEARREAQRIAAFEAELRRRVAAMDRTAIDTLYDALGAETPRDLDHDRAALLAAFNVKATE